MEDQKRNLNILSFVLLVVSLGYGIFSPILPFYIKSMGASGTELGLLNASYAVMRLIFGPIWGSVSDRIGRKRILMVGILGFGITMVWFGLATQLWMLFTARILAGILSSATAPTTMAYISDNAPEGELSKGLGRLSAAGGIGAILGPLLGGMVASDSLSTPFFIAAGLAGVSLVLAFIFLPESKPTQEEEPEKKKRMINLREWGKAIISPVGKLFTLTFVSTSGLYIFSNAFGLYGLERFGFGTEEVGVVYMVLGLVSMLSVGLLIGPATKFLGEEKTTIYGFLAAAVSLCLMLVAKGFIAILLFTTILAVAISLQSTALISLTSKHATTEQGVTMGLSNSFVSLGRIVGPIAGGVLLDININLPFAGAAGMLSIAFILSLFWIKKSKRVIKESNGYSR